MTVNELYALAAREGIEVHSIKCPASTAISMDISGTKYIGIDRKVFQSEYRERLVLAHELSHALTDAYYTDLDNPVNIKRMEYRANKQACALLVPKEQLSAALHEDVTLFELSQLFSVPEDTIRTALWLYFKKELA